MVEIDPCCLDARVGDGHIMDVFLKTAVNGSDDLKMDIFHKPMNKKFDFMYNQLRGGKFNSRIYITISLRGCYEIATNSTYLFHFYESLRLVSNTLYK